MPPSTGRTTPVTYRAASLARNSTAGAMSSGSPMRPRATRSTNFSVSARTITEKQNVYAQFLSGSSDFANTAANVFGQSADRLIKLANVSKPVLDLYAKYSVILESNNQEQLIFKHAISTVVSVRSHATAATVSGTASNERTDSSH